MNAKTIGKATQWVPHVLAVISVIIPVWVSYDLQNKGDIPTKHLRLVQHGPNNVLEDLQGSLDGKQVKFLLGERQLSNLFVFAGRLRNMGLAPIVPTDYHRNIEVTTGEDWEILAVESTKENAGDVRLEWKRLSPNSFGALPTLINPSDEIAVVIYVTSRDGTIQKSPNDIPKIKWDARITNLKEIEVSSLSANDIAKALLPSMGDWGFYVLLSGWKLVYAFGAGLLFIFIHIVLLERNGLINKRGTRRIMLLLAVVALSCSAAESSSTYLFGDLYTQGLAKITGRLYSEVTDVDHWLNLPPLLLNAALLVYLGLRQKRQQEKRGQRARTQAATK